MPQKLPSHQKNSIWPLGMIQAHPGQATTGLVAATREEATLGRNFSTFVYKALRMGVLNSAGNNKDGLKHLGCSLLLEKHHELRVPSKSHLSH